MLVASRTIETMTRLAGSLRQSVADDEERLFDAIDAEMLLRLVKPWLPAAKNQLGAASSSSNKERWRSLIGAVKAGAEADYSDVATVARGLPRALMESSRSGPNVREIETIHHEVCTQGFDPERNTFTQSYGSKELDAVTLLIPLVGLLPPDDPRVIGTVDAVRRELSTPDGLVRRYPTIGNHAGVDGLKGDEGTFILCSFWLVDALALTGRLDEARALFERLLALRNDLGLLAEEYDPVRQRQLGNFPQAFSHMGLIQSARLLHQLSTQPSPHGGAVAVPAPRSPSRGPRQTCKALTSQHA